MKPQHLYDQTSQTLVSLKFYADTSAYGLSNLQPVQVYYASMSYDFFFQERGKCFDSALQPCFDSALQPCFNKLTNHLGNVLTVISDKRMLVCNADTVTYSYASIISATDYSPFGAPLAGRTFSSENYRFRFNGKENDNEVKGEGNHQDYGFRIYDNRIGRFLSVDPLTPFYPSWSTYSFAQNRPIKASDLDGLEAWDGPKDVDISDVASLNSFQEFSKTLLTYLNSSQNSKTFDCADLAYYLLAKYYEHMKVELKFKAGKLEINSSDKKWRDFDHFFDETKLYFGSGFTKDFLTFKLPRSNVRIGDLFISSGHVMINFPQNLEEPGRYSYIQSSGADYGPENPYTITNLPYLYINASSMPGADARRFNFLKDLPNERLPQTIESKKLNSIPLSNSSNLRDLPKVNIKLK